MTRTNAAARDHAAWLRMRERRAKLIKQHRARSALDTKLQAVVCRALRRETRQDKRNAQ